ncbi:MAG TPA: hypothetical protein VI386_08665 [Candidatus Sulfotelmatobacter sp.]
MPPLLLLTAAGLARLKKPWQLGLALAVILLFSVNGTFAYYERDFDLDRDGIGVATNYVLDHAQPGDAVIFYIPETRAAYEFYQSLRKPPEREPEVLYPRHGEHLDYRDFTGKPSPDFLRSVPARYNRVWAVLMNNGGVEHPDPATMMLGEVMKESYPVSEMTRFPQVEVRLYRKH